jgi:L-alanine-DL-glutamate epimerase-like enolase superfamily enzyme
MKITDVKMYPVKVAVKPIEDGGIAPYKGSKDAVGTSSATSAIYKVTTDEGIVGWGEMNMILSLRLTKTILEDALMPAIIGQDPFNLNVIKRSIDSLYNPDINMLHFFSGVEMALWDIMGKATNKPIYKLLGGCVRPAAPIAYAMGIMEEKQTASKIEQIIQEGFKTVKTKGGLDVTYDIKRAKEMRKLAGDNIDFRVDMNQAYNLAEAVSYLSGVAECRLQYVEQPMPVNCFDHYRALRERCTVPIAINEDCYIPGGLFNAIKLNAVDVGVVDMESIGGISELVKLAHIAEAANLPLAHHCAWDMGIKTAAIVHCVCALDALKLPMDSTYHAHREDVLCERVKISDGSYVLPEGNGLGVEVDEKMLMRLVCEDKDARYVF